MVDAVDGMLQIILMEGWKGNKMVGVDDFLDKLDENELDLEETAIQQILDDCLDGEDVEVVKVSKLKAFLRDAKKRRAKSSSSTPLTRSSTPSRGSKTPKVTVVLDGSSVVRVENPKYRNASVSERLIVSLVDMIVSSVHGGLTSLVAGYLSVSYGWLGFLFSVLAMIYVTVQLWNVGATLGMYFCNIRWRVPSSEKHLTGCSFFTTMLLQALLYGFSGGIVLALDIIMLGLCCSKHSISEQILGYHVQVIVSDKTE